MSKLVSASVRAAISRRLPPSMSMAAAVATREMHDQGGDGRIGPRAVLTEPAAEPLERPLGVSRDRLIGQPVLEVLRQLAHRVITLGQAPGPSPSGRSLRVAPVSCGRAPAAAGNPPSMTFSMTSEIFLPGKATLPVSSS